MFRINPQESNYFIYYSIFRFEWIFLSKRSKDNASIDTFSNWDIRSINTYLTENTLASVRSSAVDKKAEQDAMSRRSHSQLSNYSSKIKPLHSQFSKKVPNRELNGVKFPAIKKPILLNNLRAGNYCYITSRWSWIDNR